MMKLCQKIEIQKMTLRKTFQKMNLRVNMTLPMKITLILPIQKTTLKIINWILVTQKIILRGTVQIKIWGIVTQFMIQVQNLK